MSLKAFHIVFVAASVILMAFLTGWSFLAYQETHSADYLVWSLCAACSVVGLAFTVVSSSGSFGTLVIYEILFEDFQCLGSGIVVNALLERVHRLFWQD